MNGPYKTSSWDIGELQALVDELATKGLAVEAEWRSDHVLQASPEQADNIRLVSGGKLFLSQKGRKGSVFLEALPPEQTRQVLASLYQRKFLSAPDFTLGILLAVIYVLLYLVGTLPALLDIGGPLLLMVSIVSLICAGAAVSLMRSVIAGRSGPRKGWKWLGLPGLILHVPGLLLVVPLCSALFRQALLQRARECAAPSQVQAGDLQGGLG